MTEEDVKRLRFLATRQERTEYERDILILHAKHTGDRMTDIAAAAGVSRQHAYRIAQESEALFDIQEETLGDGHKVWEHAFKCKTWTEFNSTWHAAAAED
jgi:hypothetical protein